MIFEGGFVSRLNKPAWDTVPVTLDRIKGTGPRDR